MSRIAVVLAVSFSFFYAHTLVAKEPATKKVASRKLASIKQLRPTLNQTEAMLQSPHAAPRLLDKEPFGSAKHSRLGFYGVCRDKHRRSPNASVWRIRTVLYRATEALRAAIAA